ncbi:MAG TPA: hypothetical protein RMH85_25895 [Polyangiaceae bacterium LLY-WYZ-15_(1-7)]|nr:hypothetical protein [Sandaracinus sp.]HJK89179.1 hypothetical protein [Polyangiaceae bacterium LLY-WYZ-15_(1-7)]MBJ73388.1 hypothetical protein [Sandaracinus sp.]HJL01477.1 hypothetical protein [Polyangiaceae bacterium LLY-WYZ-15_(1-7)]HJL11934.1 hypothetical protein [Polyangiaceae bacterium LLY-WYZ-15_(1-7)]
MADDDAYESYQGFLRASMKRYWDRKGSSKVTFLALMFATRQAWGVAVKGAFSAESGKRALGGAAGVAAAAVLIRVFLGGPLGLLLAGASAVSLIAVYGRNQEAIWRKVVRFRAIMDEYEERYEALREQHASGDFDDDQRDLMMEGLMARFLDELDTVPDDEGDDEEEAAEEQRSFAAHVARRREADADADDDDER